MEGKGQAREVLQLFVKTKTNTKTNINIKTNTNITLNTTSTMKEGLQKLSGRSW